jgi:hypothetical protein
MISGEAWKRKHKQITILVFRPVELAIFEGNSLYERSN